jgi:alpha-beta hydrolase superfamily lysophospholipase
MTHPCTLERIQAEDGVELCGLLSVASSNSPWGLLHVHGLSGNFYEQGFVDNLLEAGVKSGFRVLLFNNRGHDYFSDAIVRTDNKKSIIARGGAHERLSEGIADIRAAINFLHARGISQIVITAHSTGAVKAALYVMRESHPSLKGIVMISPSDDVGIQKSNAGGKFDELLDEAKRIVSLGTPDKLMKEEAFYYPVDAQAYVELFDPQGEGNVFDLTGSGHGLTPLRVIKVPVLVIFGSEDIAVSNISVEGAARALVDAVGSSEESRFRIIHGAGHDYAGFERTLGGEVQLWLEAIRGSSAA